MHSVSVNLEPPQYLAGWRSEAGLLFLPALSESRVGDEVAVRVGIYGQTIRATLFGKVSMVRRVGRPALPPGVELVLDRTSQPAASFLAMAARGEQVSFRERSPRFGVERKVPVAHGDAIIDTSTLNLSEGGCAVRWSGQLPLVGDVVQLRLGEGLFAPSARAVVCWNQPGGPVERSVGLRVVGEGRAGKAWRALVADVARSGARAACPSVRRGGGWPAGPARSQPGPGLDAAAAAGETAGVIRYQLLATDGAARRGRLHSARGTVETPVFMPVGTAASVKTLEPRDLEAMGARIVLGNTYHLFLRPGHQLIEKLGGLHRFMAWTGLTLTDSGGFQVFSLGERAEKTAAGASVPKPGPGLVTIAEEGVTFRSHLDGSKQFLSPERATDIQLALGADVIMAFDECPPSLADRAYHEQSLARTQRWLGRCRHAWEAGSRRRADAGLTPSALFGIAQGGLFPDLRAKAIEEAAALDLPGYALGGYAVGEAPATMWEGVARDAPLLPAGKPRYLMGVGTPEDLLAGIAAGIDMFDCVLPTRTARNGLLFTSKGRLNVKNARFTEDERPLDEACGCHTCRTHTRAYLRHLFRADELTGLRLNSIHNVHYFLALMADARSAIEAGRFEAFRAERTAAWKAGLDG